MSRSPISNLLKTAFAETIAADTDLKERFAKWKTGRREFIKNMTVMLGSATMLPSFTERTDGLPEIAIIGAGMAGLNAAHQLRKHGVHAKVYEASSRAGGRMFTLHDYFGDKLTTDIGGEFVDSTHLDILQLAKEFDLSFYDLRQDKLSPKTFYFGGKHLDQSDLRTAIAPFAKQIAEDIFSLPPLIDHTTADKFRHLDEQSITEYLSALGIKGWLYDFLNVVLTREYGMDAGDQSSVNFLIMFVPPLDTDLDYEVFGPSHEIFKIKGGSQNLTDRMYESLKDQVFLNRKFSGLEQNGKGGYNLSFLYRDQKLQVHADYVIIAIPFSILRTLSMSVPIVPEKKKCIDELGYGNSCKFILGVNDKPWRKLNMQGYTFTDEKFGAGWDSSQMQSLKTGSFTVFGGGQFGDDMNQMKEKEVLENCMSSLDVIYPGIRSAYANKDFKYCWAFSPFAKGGYSAFKKGQWSTLSGWEGVPVGNIYFAGEHVSKEFQGYMNGAAETSRVAVEEVLKKIRNNKSQKRIHVNENI